MHPRAPETDVRAAASSPVGHAARRRAAMPRTWRHASQSPAGGRSWPGHATRPRRSIPVITNPGAASKRPAPAEVFSVAGTLLSTSSEDGIPEILAEQRLGHQVPGMRGLYAHASDRMRDELKAALQARWEESLTTRAAIHPHSPVPLLDELLTPHRDATQRLPAPVDREKMISQIPPKRPEAVTTATRLQPVLRASDLARYQNRLRGQGPLLPSTSLNDEEPRSEASLQPSWEWFGHGRASCDLQIPPS